MDTALNTALDDGVIDESLGQLKSGKEATIYLVRKGDQIMAAKVYKDRAQRSFQNNADYKEGRKTRNSRTQRAIDSGGRFGRAAAEQAWKATESTALSMLYARGVRVPKPVMFYEGVLIMELVLDENGHTAPRLIDVALAPGAARTIYLDLRAQIIAMLCCEIIHGDLSPYNILAAAAGPTIIDFPQMVSPAHNSRAEFFFLRDFRNVLDWAAASDATLLPHRADGPAIWRAYVARDLTPDFIPPPPPPPGARGPDRPRRDARPPRGPQAEPPRRPQPEPQRRPQPEPQRRPQPEPQRRPQPEPQRRPQNEPPRPGPAVEFRRTGERGPQPPPRRPEPPGPAVEYRRSGPRGPAPDPRPAPPPPPPPPPRQQQRPQQQRPQQQRPQPGPRRPDPRPVAVDAGRRPPDPRPNRPDDRGPRRGPPRPPGPPPGPRPPQPDGGHRRRPKRRG